MGIANKTKFVPIARARTGAHRLRAFMALMQLDEFGFFALKFFLSEQSLLPQLG